MSNIDTLDTKVATCMVILTVICIIHWKMFWLVIVMECLLLQVNTFSALACRAKNNLF